MSTDATGQDFRTIPRSELGDRSDAAPGDEVMLDGGCWRVDQDHADGTVTVVRAARAYAVSQLPTFRGEAPEGATELLYRGVCASWRMLVDVRFKLLAIVPSVAAIALGILLRAGVPRAAQIAGCALGLVVTLGIWLYDRRNSELHDDLISRGRRLEHELGVETGQFLGRRTSRPPVQHDTALLLVYAAVAAAWLVGLIWALGHD